MFSVQNILKTDLEDRSHCKHTMRKKSNLVKWGINYQYKTELCPQQVGGYIGDTDLIGLRRTNAKSTKHEQPLTGKDKRALILSSSVFGWICCLCATDDLC
jgi:hypothetical protein